LTAIGVPRTWTGQALDRFIDVSHKESVIASIKLLERIRTSVGCVRLLHARLQGPNWFEPLDMDEHY